MSVECSIADQSDNDARGQLSEKQFLVVDVAITLRTIDTPRVE